MADIQYDPACVRCRIDAGRDVAGTTWQCYPHVQAERDSLWLALAEATRERDDATAAANIRAAEHRKERDLRAQAERERDEARALAVSWEREFNVANHERLRLWDEAENLREKVGQFEAAGFPNVASVLDRIALLSRARETDGAVREAAERLARHVLDVPMSMRGMGTVPHAEAIKREGLAVDLLHALSSPPRPDFIRCALPRGECCHQRIPPVLPLEAPECNDGDDCCRYCGRGLQPCGACKPAAPPADAATEATGYPPTLADARMHVERLTRSLSQPHSADERFFAINEARTWLAKTAGAKADAATEAVRRDWTLCPQCGVRHAWADPDDPCAPLSTPAPAPSADRCAAGHDWIRRGEGSCGDRYVCLRCGERKP